MLLREELGEAATEAPPAEAPAAEAPAVEAPAPEAAAAEAAVSAADQPADSGGKAPDAPAEVRRSRTLQYSLMSAQRS